MYDNLKLAPDYFLFEFEDLTGGDGDVAGQLRRGILRVVSPDPCNWNPMGYPPRPFNLERSDEVLVRVPLMPSHYAWATPTRQLILIQSRDIVGQYIG